MVRYLGEDGAEIGFGIDAVELGGLDQGQDAARSPPCPSRRIASSCARWRSALDRRQQMTPLQLGSSTRKSVGIEPDPAPQRLGAHCLTKNVTGGMPVMTGGRHRIGSVSPNGETDQHGRSARDYSGGFGTLSISGLDGEGTDPRRVVRNHRLHRQHAMRRLAVGKAPPSYGSPDAPLRRAPTYGATIKDALVALWEASDRICGKRPKVMIPALLPALVNDGQKARKDDGGAHFSRVRPSTQVSSGSSCVRLERLFLRPGLPPGGRSARRLSNARQRHRSHAPAWRGATV